MEVITEFVSRTNFMTDIYDVIPYMDVVKTDI